MPSRRHVPSSPEPVDLADLLDEVPEPPCYLSMEAAAEWRRLAPAAIAVGGFRGADLGAFELLVEMLATERKARAILATEGYTVPVLGGGCKTHPAVRIMETARRQAHQMLNEFGLTPRGREGLSPQLDMPSRPLRLS